MLDDAVKALNQMLSPRLRAVLWKSIGLALALIIAVGIALDRLIVWLVGAGGRSVETTLGPQAHLPATALGWLISIAAGLGIVVGSVMLMPAVTAVVASFFADQIAEEVERVHYPNDPPGVALPLWLAVLEGGKTALLAVAIYHLRHPVSAFRRVRRDPLLSWPLPGCSGANISSSPPCAFGRPSRRRPCASAMRRPSMGPDC